jgi:signal transduction histidine kinase
MLARLRALDPFRADLLLAAALFLEQLLELAVLPPEGAPNLGWAVAFCFVLCLSVAIRRRWPLVSAAVAMPLFIGFSGLGAEYGDHMISPFFTLLFLLYTYGRRIEGRALYAVLVYALGCVMISQGIDSYDDSATSYFISVGAVVGGPILLGRVLRNRAALNRTLREKAHLLERNRADRARAAAGEERTRIAGELHDVVAHALSAMVVQASGARRLAERDPQRAAEAFRAVETSGREALTEIRRLLGVLRREDEELALSPQPSLAHLADLVARVRRSGLAVELAVEGERSELPAGVDLTAYRVVQEALGSALGADGARRASVRVRYGADEVDLEVTDVGDGAADDDRPLLGMRERVALYGGRLDAGGRPGGGFVVRVLLPVR